VVGIIWLVLGLGFLAVAWYIRRDIREPDPAPVLPGVMDPAVASQLSATGVTARATVQAFKFLGQSHEGATLVEVTLGVAGLDDAVATRAYVPLTEVDRLEVGATVPVQYDRADPTRLTATWSRFATL
jgi:hypothetical protein